MLHHGGEPLLLVIEKRVEEDYENDADNDDLMKHEGQENRDEFSLLCKGDPLLHQVVDHKDTTICDKNADNDDDDNVDDTDEELEESESISLPLLYSCRDSLD